MKATVLLPALDEEGAVADVVRDMIAAGVDVLVVDNGSSDSTGARAQEAGARVIVEPQRGYGSACLAGIRALRDDPPDVVVFADCDGSIDAADIPAVLAPIASDEADVVLGDRRMVDKGALPLPNRAARVAARVMFALLYLRSIRDVPPLRAVSWPVLERLGLEHEHYGLPVETVAKALRHKARIVHVPVAYRRRAAGQSKVGVDLPDALRVGWTMAWTTVRLRFGRLA